MGMPTVASVGTVVDASTGTLTVAPGATHTTDDIDVVIVEGGAADATLSTANGFAELTAVSPQGTGSGGSSTRFGVFWRRWNGSDGSPIFAGVSNHAVGRMISISGCKTSGNPWNVTATGTTDSSADTSLSAAGATTTAADCLILAFAGQNLPDASSTTEFGSPTNADLANLTERIDNATAQGNGGAIWLVTGEKATAGAYGATTCTTVTSALRVCGSIALEGASAGGAAADPYPYIGVGYYPTQG